MMFNDLGRFRRQHGLDLTERSLRFANFAGALLPGVTLFGADVSGARFSSANLNGADLEGACMTNGINLENAKLNGANLVVTEMDDIDFQCTELNGADFSGSEISNAEFIYTKLNGAIFPETEVCDSVLIDVEGVAAEETYDGCRWKKVTEDNCSAIPSTWAMADMELDGASQLSKLPNEVKLAWEQNVSLGEYVARWLEKQNHSSDLWVYCDSSAKSCEDVWGASSDVQPCHLEWRW